MQKRHFQVKNGIYRPKKRNFQSEKPHFPANNRIFLHFHVFPWFHSKTHRFHYIKLADIPFVAGQSCTKSHHTGANIQQLLADLKTSRSMIRPHTHRKISESSSREQIKLPHQARKELYRNVVNLREEFCEWQEKLILVVSFGFFKKLLPVQFLMNVK